MRVIVRREFFRDAMAVWFCEQQFGNVFKVAKPVTLEFVETEAGLVLPEPTLSVPGVAVKQFYEGFAEQMEMNGEQYLESRTAIKKQDAHLLDLRNVNNRLLGLLERK